MIYNIHTGNKMKIAIVGAGYVGYSNGLLFASKNEVILLDIDKKKVETINNGHAPFLDERIEQYLLANKLCLTATLDKEEAYKDADYILIAVPTNYRDDINEFDSSIVEEVVKDILSINSDAWIIIRSTLGVGFTKHIMDKYHYDRIIFSPEFLREDSALDDNLAPSRIVVGIKEKNDPYLEKANEFISLIKTSSKKEDIATYITGIEEAEAIKLFSNTYLALRVAFFNELDTFASIKGLNTLDIINGVSSDPRIGNYYNNPSFGYGGYCLPKDTKELKANYGNVPENIISAIIESNRTRKEFIASEIIKKASICHKKGEICIGIYRLTMKTNSSSFRYSSLKDIISLLRKDGYKIIIYEPHILDDNYDGIPIVNELEKFKKMSTLIVSSRRHKELTDVEDKVYTKDFLKRD